MTFVSYEYNVSPLTLPRPYHKDPWVQKIGGLTFPVYSFDGFI